MANAGGNFYFDPAPPKVPDTDRQAHYEEVVNDNKELLQALSEAVFRYCESGSCEELALLIRSIHYIVESGQQLLIDSKACLKCMEHDCSAAGSGEGLVDGDSTP